MAFLAYQLFLVKRPSFTEQSASRRHTQRPGGSWYTLIQKFCLNIMCIFLNDAKLDDGGILRNGKDEVTIMSAAQA